MRLVMKMSRFLFVACQSRGADGGMASTEVLARVFWEGQAELCVYGYSIDRVIAPCHAMPISNTSSLR